MTSIDERLFRQALDEAITHVRERIDQYVDAYPHVSTNQAYKKEANHLWTSSFWTGMVYLSYDYTRDERLLKHADKYLHDFQKRLTTDSADTHDLGFLYTLSCVALYKLTGHLKARNVAIEAASKLAGRFHRGGQYIRAWETDTMKVDLMIDTMMNLPLLFWATAETADQNFTRIAVAHAKTTAETLVRNDGSTYHIYETDSETGKPLKGKTFQGRYDESTWARGQAWAIYGYALCYKYTNDSGFLQLARNAADYFLAHLPEDSIPYWDLSFTDDDPDLRDSSAASIAACGLFELAHHLRDRGELYAKAGQTIVKSLYEKHFTGTDQSLSTGLITEGVYHRDRGADEFTVWGDYFYMEALVRMNMDWKSYW